MDRYGFDRHLSQLGVKPSGKILVAVSGGMDSMSLLHALHNSSLGLKCSVAHVNFHLRAGESDLDELMVREWCAERGIEFFVKHADTLAYAKKHAVSTEMAARELRYSWFGDLMREGGFDFLAIAHNAGDNAETLILNLVRGTGIRGLCGIAANRDYILRPLLCYTREQIEKYALKFNVPYRVDHTNLQSDFSRNRIRNEVFPHLKKINPSLIKILNRNIRYFAMACGMLDEVINEKKKRLLKEGNSFEKGAVEIKELLKEEFFTYILYEILQDYGFNPSQVEDISASLNNSQVKRFFSPGHIVVKERGMLKIYDISIAAPVRPVIMKGEGYYDFAGMKIMLELKDNEMENTLFPEDAGILAVSADHLVFPLLCRHMVAGDRFIPFGMRGMKKVSDFLTDIKTDNILRHRIPVLLNGCRNDKKNPDGDIICLPGLRIDSRFRITPATGKILLIKILS